MTSFKMPFKISGNLFILKQTSNIFILRTGLLFLFSSNFQKCMILKILTYGKRKEISHKIIRIIEALYADAQCSPYWKIK